MGGSATGLDSVRVGRWPVIRWVAPLRSILAGTVDWLRATCRGVGVRSVEFLFVGAAHLGSHVLRIVPYISVGLRLSCFGRVRSAAT